jgi:hypothetical protein
MSPVTGVAMQTSSASGAHIMHRTLVLAWAACLVLATSTMAAEPEVYPTKGQTAG